MLELLYIAAGVGLGFILYYVLERYLRCRAMEELVKRIREGEAKCLTHSRIVFPWVEDDA